ncbi:phosphatidylglycerophosphatase A family protein [Paraburkholderia unamae]|uniref:Phosphatidylglycerophosphatase n=1 Tax=Paraburkholderia unamae TaxID=219649 RepID=A0ABX5L0W1_9BURK|nr:phosphatidylglycerophosphatase A [Paraburkholderia unamae]PVX97925.1 phosphatidylglycerophosphatase [Paraburkholderia unamae]
MQTDPTPSPADEYATGGQPAPAKGPASGAPKPGPRRADAAFMLTHPLHIVSLGFGSGLSRLAPGTAGTLFAWAAFEVLNRYLTVTEWGLLIMVGFFAGIAITGFTAKKLSVEDPSAIVWDEIVAFWLVLLMITPVDFTGRLWAFVVFRFFDTVKPPPIRYFDRHFKGGLGIMLDDIVAAFFTLLVIALWRMSV